VLSLLLAFTSGSLMTFSAGFGLFFWLRGIRSGGRDRTMGYLAAASLVLAAGAAFAAVAMRPVM
jgi:hypothetical protein